VFGRYNAAAYLCGALGSLAAGGPAFLRRVWTGAPADRRWFLVLPIVATLCVAIARGLSPAMEPEGSPRDHRPLERSRRSVRRLSGLFALDSFAGGFVVSSFIVFWFARRYDVGPEVMSLVLFAAGLLQAASSIVAARLGARIGLLNTMVFTHLPSNLLLLSVPLMPAAPAAIALLLLRFALSQMDVPTRQAYLAALVDPEERTAAAGITNTSRYVVRPFGQLLGGALMSASVAAPFIAAGTLKCVYDLALSSTRMVRTSWLARPTRRMSAAATRITMPDDEMTNMSWSLDPMKAPASSPVLRVSVWPITPLPPRPFVGY